MRFQDKVVIVTGSARGLGRNHCLRFAKEGANIVVADIASDPAGLMPRQHMATVTDLEKTAEEIRTLGRIVLPIRCDVIKSDQVRAMVDNTIDKFGRIDILVNNAGFQTVSTIEDMSEESWDSVMDVNLKGTFLCSKYVIPHMKKQKYGKIVNIASSVGLKGIPLGGHYSAAKAGVIILTESLAAELAPWNINVNAVAPGITRTPFHDYLADAMDVDRKKWVDEIVSRECVFKRDIDPQSISNMVLYLASEEAKDITGQTILVDQGGLLRRWEEPKTT